MTQRFTREARHEHLLDAAAELILEHGVEAATMEAVAQAAGASKTLGYAYFPNSTELLLAVLERELAELDRRAAPAISAAHSFEDIVRAGIRAWFDLVEERGALLNALLQSKLLRGPVAERRQQLVRDNEVLYGRIAEQQFGIPFEIGVAAAAMFLGGLGGVIDRWVATGEPRVHFEETYVQAVVGALNHLRSFARSEGA